MVPSRGLRGPRLTHEVHQRSRAPLWTTKALTWTPAGAATDHGKAHLVLLGMVCAGHVQRLQQRPSTIVGAITFLTSRPVVCSYGVWCEYPSSHSTLLNNSAVVLANRPPLTAVAWVADSMPMHFLTVAIRSRHVAFSILGHTTSCSYARRRRRPQ